jgi:type IV pilus assembly protein PilN
VRQDTRKVTLVGLAQSNERISTLLRNLANESGWLERPELLEIKAVPLAAQQGGKPAQDDGRRVYEFSINAMIRGPQTGVDEAGGKPAPVPAARK